MAPASRRTATANERTVHISSIPSSKRTAKWRMLHARVCAVLRDTKDDDPNLVAGVAAHLGGQNHVHQLGHVEVHAIESVIELAVNVCYGPILGGSPTDLRRWMSAGLADAGLGADEICVLDYERRQVTREQAEASVSMLTKASRDPKRRREVREWTSRRARKLAQEFDLPVTHAEACTLST